MLSNYVQASGDRSILARALPLAEVRIIPPKPLLKNMLKVFFTFRKSWIGGTLSDLFK
jgi:hypothetical protein